MFACENVLCQIKGKKRREKAIYIDTQIGQDIFPNFLRRSALCIVPDLGPSFMQASALVNNTVSSILLSLFFRTQRREKNQGPVISSSLYHFKEGRMTAVHFLFRKGAIRGGVINYSLFMYVYVKFGEFNSGVWPYVDLFMRLFSCWIKAQLKGWRIFAF